MTEEEYSVVNETVKKKVIKEGSVIRRPSLGWTCGVTLAHENQESKEDVEITIGNGCTPKDRLIELCLKTMRLHEQSSFIIKLDTYLMLNITLNSYKEKPYIYQWSDEEKLQLSNFYKSMGVELFKQENIQEAFYKFSNALKLTLLLDSVLETDEPESEINELRIALYNNLAACHLHFKNYSSVVKLCTSSIRLNSSSKALYRRALSYIELKEYEKAESDLTELLKAEPRNKAALEKYKLVRELDRSNRENYESIVKKMFN